MSARFQRREGGGDGTGPALPARRVARVRAAFPGLGTVINVVAVIIGALLGMAIGHRLPERTRSVE